MDKLIKQPVKWNQMLAKIFLYLFLFALCPLLIASANLMTAEVVAITDVNVLKIETLSQVSDPQSPDIIYFFDIDDTLIDSPCMLGSKAWRKYIREVTKSDATCNWHDIFSLFVARNHPVKPVEVTTTRYVKELQEKGYGVFGLTAREREIWYSTPVTGVEAVPRKGC